MKGLPEQIRERSWQLLRQAEAICAYHGVAVPDPLIRFDLTGRAAGQAQWGRGARPVLRYNLEIAKRHAADFLARTVAHEVAHLVVAACHHRARPHGAEWRAVMAQLGIENPSRCHDYELPDTGVKRQRRWLYVCDCTRHELSTTRHRRVIRGTTRYHCRKCGSLLRPGDCRPVS